MTGGVQRLLIGPCVQKRSLRSPLEAGFGNCDRLLGAELSKKIHGNHKPGRGSHRMHIQIFGQFRIVFEAVCKEIHTARARRNRNEPIFPRVLLVKNKGCP